MVDVHCHLNFHSFEKDLDEVVKRAFDAGVTKIINVGTSIPSSIKAIELAHKFNSPAGEMYAIIGVHPHHADKADREFEGEIQTDWLEKLTKLTSEDNVVGIGEIGLDYHAYKSNGIVDKRIQEDAFRKQIELSIERKLPLQIHNRLAGEDIVKILMNYKNSFQNPPGMFHCMSGDISFLKKVLDLGFYVGFDGNITYKGIAKGETIELSELVKYAPLNRIVTETDSPFLTPQPYRGSRNEPSHVIIVAKFIAKLKGISFEKVSQQTTENAEAVFKLNS